MIPADAADSGDARDNDARDGRLMALFDLLSEQRDRGEAVDIDAVARAHPDLAGELRTLWSTAAIADDVARLCDTTSSRLDAAELADAAGAVPERDGILPERIGEFVVVEEVGRGGMGVVYKARQESLGRTVALKAVLRGAFASDSDRTRFRIEAQSVARLEHPNIVPVYDVGEHGGQPYFTMPFVEGTTLAARLADGPMAPKEAVRLLEPVCRAIEHAHRHGVLHRDLKPANILLDEGEPNDGAPRPFVTDFGLAKRVESSHDPARAGESVTTTGAVIGTPSYMSPEQAAPRLCVVTTATDIYSLGAILYHALTGRPPFQSTSPVRTILQVIEEDPLPPRLLEPQVDRDLEMVVLRCLQKPVDMRYRSAGELADDLAAYLADEPVTASSGRFLDIVARMFRETHHAVVLENWGVLWMWHSLVLLVVCVFTNALHWWDIRTPVPYMAVWTVGLGAWAAIFWALRRRGGPVTFVERQIAHVWGASVISVALLSVAEVLMGLDVLELTPVLALVSGTVFLTKAGILSGRFYVQAVASYLTVIPMALLPDYSLTIFGIVGAACFFVPGLKYYRQRRRG